jgi:hypothetical protein
MDDQRVILHLRGHVSRRPSTRIGKGIGSDTGRPRCFEHEGGLSPYGELCKDPDPAQRAAALS